MELELTMKKWEKLMSNTKGTSTDAWLEFLSNGPGKCCGLCGNSGYIDTLKSAITPRGVKCGIQAYCICPNGRAIKKQTTGQKKWEGTSILK